MSPFSVLRSLVLQAVRRRSPKWRALERAYLAIHDHCAACGGAKGLEVHHVKPFHLFPALELDPGNLITLCTPKRCHLALGHGGSWLAYVPAVRELAEHVLDRPWLRADVERAARETRRR